eukprot:CCRYP_001224-RC/>CCRYP_001224-RC protein AED:0.17 eAED:0.17 QI:97/1/1/1/1/1/4/304/518
MREATKLLLSLLFAFLSSSFLHVHISGTVAHAATVDEETCTPGGDGDGTCASPLLVVEEGVDVDDVDDEEDDDSNCIDDDESCAIYASQGACLDNPGYMTYHCSRSCGTCDAARKAIEAAEFVEEGDEIPCMDDHYQCLEWAGMGECDANPGYMLRKCKRACLVCYEGTNQFGVEQRIPRESHIENIVSYIDRSIEYMKRVWREKEFSRVRHKCRNQHEDCTYWASLGECDANPKYMQLNCAPACQTCDLLDIKHRCPIEPGNEVIWKPGDLNGLFENIVDNADGSGEYLHYNPKALSRPQIRRDGTHAPNTEKDGPWIVLLDNFVSEEEADRLVAIGKQQGYERSADVGKEKPDGSHEALVSDSRTSHNTWCQEPSCYDDPLVKPVIDRIANVTKTEVRNSEYLQLLQYEPGQYYKQHHDYIGHHLDMPCGVRILTLFIYLNDVEEGGGTSFPIPGVVVTPKKGSAVLWPSVRDDEPEQKDWRTDHEALPVIKGLKYGANAWIHSRDFKAAFKRNCH